LADIHGPITLGISLITPKFKRDVTRVLV
jgi:hypothetical protein